MATKHILTDHDHDNVSRILNLPDAASAQEPATYAQLNAAIEGLAQKDSVRVSTQSNINLSAPGSTIDGITMASGDRFLARAQTTVPQNGIYVWNGAAVAATRSADASTFAELEGALVPVEEGTDAGVVYRQTAVNGVIDTNDVLFVTFGSNTPDATETVKGKAEIATQAETDAGTDDARIVTPLKLATSPWAKKKYATDIGDGSATSYTVTHNLGTRDVMVTLYRNSGNFDEPDYEVRHATTNTITVLFTTAPTSNAWRVVVIA